MKIILSYIMATIILLFLLALPIAGVVAYIRLIRKMRREQITAIPKFSLFMLFLICGTLLMEILLGISGMWSGASTARFIFRLVWNDSLAASASQRNIQIPLHYFACSIRVFAGRSGSDRCSQLVYHRRTGLYGADRLA